MTEKKYVYKFAEGNANMRELLGGKGANLAEMKSLHLPVPEGYTITTEACIKYYDDGEKISDDVQAQIDEYTKWLEEETGMKLGDPVNPQLVSVRSGARASMPGMMDTILNLGMNDEVVKVVEKKSGNKRFAYDSYRRFVMMFGDVVMGLEKAEFEKMIDGYTGFLFLDDNGNPLVAMHWEHRFNHMVKRYNDIYRIQMPNITPHICRHTYCSNMAKSGMNPKTLQYLMGHSEIGVTLNTYTNLGLEDATNELKRMEDLENARKELDKTSGRKTVTQKMFRVV